MLADGYTDISDWAEGWVDAKITLISVYAKGVGFNIPKAIYQYYTHTMTVLPK